MADWQENLETVGAEIFQTYRKRLMQPGIAMEIRRAYPGLSMVDVLIRVHAGRQIIQVGDDFCALQAIRSGRWQQTRQERENRPVVAEGRRDQVSRMLVNLGGLLFAGFCLLSLLAAVSDGPGGWLIGGCGTGVCRCASEVAHFLGWTGGWIVIGMPHGIVVGPAVPADGHCVQPVPTAPGRPRSRAPGAWQRAVPGRPDSAVPKSSRFHR